MKLGRWFLMGTVLTLAAPLFAQSPPSPAEIEAERAALFAQADADGNGALSLNEFKTFESLMRDKTKPSQTPERANVTLAEIETFDVPTDALLDVPSIQVLDRIPTFGCAGGGLGCIDTGEADNRSQSALDLEIFA